MQGVEIRGNEGMGSRGNVIGKMEEGKAGEIIGNEERRSDGK